MSLSLSKSVDGLRTAFIYAAGLYMVCSAYVYRFAAACGLCAAPTRTKPSRPGWSPVAYGWRSWDGLDLPLLIVFTAFDSASCMYGMLSKIGQRLDGLSAFVGQQAVFAEKPAR